MAPTKKPPGAKRAAPTKKAKGFQQEMEGYKKLFQGDITGFLAAAWADVLVLLLACGIAGVMSERFNPYFKPFFLPTHNLTFVNGTGRDEYSTGPNDLLLFTTMCIGGFIAQDIFREFGPSVFKLVTVDKTVRPIFMFLFQHAICLLLMLYFGWVTIVDEGINANLTLVWTTQEQNGMGGILKAYLLGQIAYWIQNALGLRIRDIKWRGDHYETLTFKLFTYAGSVSFLYLTGLARLATVVLMFDMVKEFLDSVVLCFDLSRPVSEKKKMQLGSMSRDDLAKILKNVSMTFGMVCRALIVVLTYLTASNMWATPFGFGGVVVAVVIFWQVSFVVFNPDKHVVPPSS